MNIEQCSIPKKRNKINKAIYERKYYHYLRNSLVELLGSKCVKCGLTDNRVLQIDHKIGSCLKDQNIFGNNHLTNLYYFKHPIFALNNLQILCANCNWIKRYENNEDNRKYEDFELREYGNNIWRKIKLRNWRKLTYPYERTPSP